jgi:hypothetical protein
MNKIVHASGENGTSRSLASGRYRKSQILLRTRFAERCRTSGM